MNDERIIAAWNDLDRAIDKLDAEQGRVARRNARSKVLAQLRRLRKAIDDVYPPIPGKRKKPAKRTPGQRARVLRERGFALLNQRECNPEIPHGVLVHTLGVVGIRIVKGPRKNLADGKWKADGGLWIPRWVYGATTANQLREGKRSSKKREELLALHLVRLEARR